MVLIVEGVICNEIWLFVFIVASLLFYGTVATVAVKGFGDVVSMVKRLLSQR